MSNNMQINMHNMHDMKTAHQYADYAKEYAEKYAENPAK
jgi:hypothetical protein